MHGLVNRSIQLFVTHTCGERIWHSVTKHADLGFTDFEGMMRYREVYTPRILDSAAAVLERPRSEIMEDIGTFIVSHMTFDRVRRLLRFGGTDFMDFVQSLDELDERIRLAISDLVLPKVEIHSQGDGQFRLECKGVIEGYSYVMMGVLRAMADDYGALVMLDHCGIENGLEAVSITVIETDFAEGRSFELGASVA